MDDAAEGLTGATKGVDVEKDFFSFFGFTSNPFENNTAEREPEIEHYAVRPPYLDRVLKTSKVKGIFVLSGTRGSGKSATRITVSKILWGAENTPPVVPILPPLVVPLINFNVFRQYTKNSIPLDLYANQVCFLVIEQIFGWLSTLDDAESTRLLNGLSSSEKSFVDKLVVNFYLNRSDTARKSSGQECFAALDLSISRKGKIWLDKRWDQVAAVVATLAAKFGKQYADFDIGDPKNYAALLQRQRQEGFDDPQYIFAKTVELARIFGFQGIVLHIDKVDETDWTSNNVSAAADLIYPLLSNIQLHEIEGLTWTFFLWDKVRDFLKPENNRQIRWDKIPNGVISWNEKYLSELIDKRIYHFSKQKLNHLADICDPNMDVKKVVSELIELSENSPRNLVTLMDNVISHHIQVNERNFIKLDLDSFSSGMDTYAINSLGNLGVNTAVEQIVRLGKDSFVTKDVAGRSRISNPAARSKIEQWVSSGLVEYAGSQVGPSGGRPVDQFVVSDPRLKRMINRSLST